MTPLEYHQDVRHQKIRRPGLPCGVGWRMIVIAGLVTQNNTQTDTEL